MTGAASQSPIPSRPRSRRGMVLLIVFVIVMMMALAGYAFSELMLTEESAVRLHGDRLQADEAIESGVAWISAFVVRPRADRGNLGGEYDNPQWFRRVALGQFPASAGSRGQSTSSAGSGSSVAADDARFTILAPRYLDGELQGPRYGLENESARLNLNAVVEWEQAATGAGRRALVQLPGMTDATAAAILDWLDADETPSAGGAEADYYQALDVAYRPRNGAAPSLEELLYVRGIERVALLGSDANRDFVVDAADGAWAPAADREASAAPASLGWNALVTLYSAERQLSSLGRAKVFLNSNDLLQLHGELGRLLDKDWADFIIAYRQFGPTSEAVAAGSAPPALDTSLPAKFTIASLVDLIDARVGVVDSSGNSLGVLASPASNDQPNMTDELLRLADAATTDPRPIVRGRVNVNHAPLEVLSAVPGIEPDLARRIVASRGDPALVDEPNRREPVWLLAERLVDAAALRTILPYVTCGGDVFRAQIVGSAGERTPVSRVEAVIDAAQTPLAVVERRDLTGLGVGPLASSLSTQGDDQEDLSPTAHR